MTNKPIVIKDIYNRNVSVGDRVAVLVKTYGFCGIDSAYIKPAVYMGKGQYGYEFTVGYNDWQGKHHTKTIRIREPQCVKKVNR